MQHAPVQHKHRCNRRRDDPRMCKHRTTCVYAADEELALAMQRAAASSASVAARWQHAARVVCHAACCLLCGKSHLVHCGDSSRPCAWAYGYYCGAAAACHCHKCTHEESVCAVHIMSMSVREQRVHATSVAALRIRSACRTKRINHQPPPVSRAHQPSKGMQPRLRFHAACRLLHCGKSLVSCMRPDCGLQAVLGAAALMLYACEKAPTAHADVQL
jgi:hypothetical protein